MLRPICTFSRSSLRGDEKLLLRQTLQSFTRKLMRGIRFTTHITDHTPATPASFANFVHCDAKTVARRHSAADHWSAISAHDHAVMRPARGGKVKRARAHVCLQLG